MHYLEKKMIDSGAIDTEIESIKIDDWFENIIIKYMGKSENDILSCKCYNCFEISLQHDVAYSKGKKNNGELDYKYFIQDIEIIEENSLYILKISAWPLSGKIVCQKIVLE